MLFLSRVGRHAGGGVVCVMVGLWLASCGSPGSSTSECGQCAENASCDASASPPACACKPGFTGDGHSCAPVTCPALTVDHGSVMPAGDGTYKATATYGC